MAKLSAGQKRRQKELKRKKKKQLQMKKQQAHIVQMGNPSGLPKLSERLLELADGILQSTDGSREAIESTIGLMTMCWNIGTVKAEKADEMRATMLEMFRDMDIGDFPEEFESELDMLITKRRVFYADDPRLIGEFKVNWDLSGHYSVQILSMSLPEEERFVPGFETMSSGMSDKAKSKIQMFENPLTEDEEQLETLLKEGNDYLNDDTPEDGVDPLLMACEVWLEAWEKIRRLYIDESSVDDINNRLSVALDLWSVDIDMHLSNAARTDPSFIERGITFCQEFCDFFPGDHATTHLNMRRTMAELQLLKGDIKQCEATFEALTRDLPDAAWGYIGWGDIYNPVFSPVANVPEDIDRAKRLYLIPIVRKLQHADDARERLDHLMAYEREARSTTTVDACT